MKVNFVCPTCGKDTSKVLSPSHFKRSEPKFCSRVCTRNSTQFKKGQKMRQGLKPPRYSWDNPGSLATRFHDGHKVNKGKVPWNKGLDFGGTEYISKRISWLSIYRSWRKQIRERDGNKCLWCGSTEHLHVDHYPTPITVIIKKYEIKSPQEAKLHQEFWDLNNGRTLCFSCHKKTPTYGKNL